MHKGIFSFFVFLAFVFSPVVLRAQSEVEELRQQLTEARELAAQARAESAQFREELEGRDAELADLRKRYATLLLATDQLSGKLVETDLAAAQLIRQGEGLTSQEEDSFRMLEVLGESRKALRELERVVNTQRETILAVLDASQASPAIRGRAEESLSQVDIALTACLVPLELVTSSDTAAAVGSCAILRLDNATQLAILDQGSLHGIRLGQDFSLRRDEKILARLQVVALRASHAAAVLTEGDFQALACGMLLHKDQ